MAIVSVGPAYWNEANQVKWVGVRPGYYGQQILISESRVNTVKQLMYTVPAGKVLLIFHTSVTLSINGVGAFESWIWIEDDGAATYHYVGYVKGCGATANNNSVSDRFSPLIVPAGYTLNLSCIGPTNYATCDIEGILVDA